MSSHRSPVVYTCPMTPGVRGGGNELDLNGRSEAGPLNSGSPAMVKMFKSACEM